MKNELRIFRQASKSEQAKFIKSAEKMIRDQVKWLAKFKREYKKAPPAKEGAS